MIPFYDMIHKQKSLSKSLREKDLMLNNIALKFLVTASNPQKHTTKIK